MFTDYLKFWFAREIAELGWYLIGMLFLLLVWGIANLYLWVTDPRRRKSKQRNK